MLLGMDWEESYKFDLCNKEPPIGDVGLFTTAICHLVSLYDNFLQADLIYFLYHYLELMLPHK